MRRLSPDAERPALIETELLRPGLRQGAPRRDGRFLNPGEEPAAQHGFAASLRMVLEGTGHRWPRRIADPPFPAPEGRVPDGHVAVTFIGHATFLLRFADGPTLLTDPIWSKRCSPLPFIGPKRVRRPGLAFEALPQIDAVLLSHNHYDHMDLPTLRRLVRRDAPRIVTGLGNAAYLARKGIPGARELDWWQGTALPGGLTVTYLPARHFSARGVTDRAKTLWGGFAIEAPAGRLLFLGDTAMGGHMGMIGDHLGPVGVALIPIGAYDPGWFMRVVHMSPEEALDAARILRARTSVAMHFGTFKLTHERIGEPAQRLHAARDAAGLAPEFFRVPRFGETLLLPLAA